MMTVMLTPTPATMATKPPTALPMMGTREEEEGSTNPSVAGGEDDAEVVVVGLAIRRRELKL